MHTSFAVAAGLVAVAYAGTTTITDTVDVTITSCEASVTNCPYKPTGDATWSDWVSASTTSTKPVVATSTSGAWDPTWSDWSVSSSTTTKPVSAATTSSGTWADWESTTTSTPVAPVSSTPGCGVYTATAPPAWFSLLPTDQYSSIAAKWTGAPPADWCYYTYSASSLVTATPTATVWASSVPVAAASGWASSVPVAAASTTSAAWAQYTSGSPVAPATFTGAANANTGSFAFAGLVAAAALVMA